MDRHRPHLWRLQDHKWGQITVPTKPTNCAFGGADGKTLLITAPKALYQVTLQIPGLPTK